MTAKQNSESLRQALRFEAKSVALRLLGSPNKPLSTTSMLRWGSRGSLVISVSGPKQGFWFDHQADEGGDLLGLIQRQLGCNFPDAVAWARDFTGLVEPRTKDDVSGERRPAYQVRRQAERAQRNATDQAGAEAEQANKIVWVQRTANETVPIEGTPADLYLRQVRGIPRPKGGWPAIVRWHPRFHALVAVATLADGTVQRIQRTHLTMDGNKVDAVELKARQLAAVKMTNGPAVGGAAVRLPGDQTEPLLVAEGLETGLAAWVSTGFETWVALGNVGKMELPAGRKVLVLRDDDRKHSQADLSHHKAVGRWRKAGLDVMVVTPWSKRRHDKSDLADVILAEGPAAVAAQIEWVLVSTGKPFERTTLEEGRQVLDAALGRFFDQVDAISARRAGWKQQTAMAGMGEGALSALLEECDSDVFTHAVRVDVGVGKSHSAREHIVRLVIAMRARRDTRSAALLVPAHVLGDEQAAAFRAMPELQAAGLTIATYRGRNAADPDHPDYRNPNVPPADRATMCRDLDRVWDAQAIGLNAQEAVCRRMVQRPDGTKAEEKCPLFDSCPYQQQRQTHADIWIAAHDVLFHEKPENTGELAVVVVDEAAWRKGLIGTDSDRITLSLDALGQNNVVQSRRLGDEDRVASDRLRDLRRQVSELLAGLPDGPVRRADLNTTLTPEACSEALKLEFERRVYPLHPGQTRQERKAAVEAAQANTTIRRTSMMWTALRVMLSPGAPEASGWIEVDTEATKDGPVRVMRLKGRSEIKKGWRVPTLLADALLPIDLVRHLWPGAELTADVLVEAPHQRIHQVTDRSFSLSMLKPLSAEEAEADPQEARRRSNRLRDLHGSIVALGRRYAPGQVLVVLQQHVEAALPKLGALPSNVVTAHHNNVAGRDEWRNAACLIVVGRTLPPPRAIEEIRAALTGEAVPTPMTEWYDRVDAVRHMEDGSTIPAEKESHTDFIAEVIRWQTMEGELLQIIGRVRGVSRTATNPVDVFVLTDAPLPLPLASTLLAVELLPTAAQRMMAKGGIVFENARHAFAAYPDLWPSHNAADLAIRRSPSFPYIDTIRGTRRTLRVDYRIAGRGQKATAAWFDPDVYPDPEVFLARVLGTLAWCRIGGQDEEERHLPVSQTSGSRQKPALADQNDEGGASSAENGDQVLERHPVGQSPPRNTARARIGLVGEWGSSTLPGGFSEVITAAAIRQHDQNAMPLIRPYDTPHARTELKPDPLDGIQSHLGGPITAPVPLGMMLPGQSASPRAPPDL